MEHALHTPLPLPKYHQVYLVLRQQLEQGRFAAGLPGEVALAAQFGVARVTVRRALGQLAAEGRVLRRPGRGTRPHGPSQGEAWPSAGGGDGAPNARAGAGKAATARSAQAGTSAHPDALHHAPYGGLLHNIVTLGLSTQVQVLTCAVQPASAMAAQALGLQPGQPVHRAQRIRSTAEGPMSLITTHVPAALARGITRRALARQPILLLLEANGVRMGHAEQTLSACLADAQVAQHLQVPAGAALLAVTRLVHDDQGRSVQWLHGLYRPDRYPYQMQLSRVGRLDAKVWMGHSIDPQFH